MIPSTTNKLLVASDWTKIYQSFRNSEFKSYDFETLRRTMIAYLRENYPEEFNDYIDSSEYIALIDLIAYLGQNLSFRVDLNARENFIETAARRESILRLARLINYNPKRNVPANGLLKITSISTTENIIDVNGINLANSIVGWNDPSNSNWYQQFITILNAAFAKPSYFGKPFFKKIINGISTEQYRLATSTTDVPIFSFIKNIGGTQMNFELVSANFSDKNYIHEEPPLPANQFGIIFQNDNQGSGSQNTGFFVHFRQGVLGASNFSVVSPVPNELIGVNVADINDTDVWLWQMSADNSTHQTLWTKVPSVTGNNIIYNSLDKNERNIYAVLSRENDQIDLSFADGSFGNLPNGPFRLYYRQSNGLSYTIKPEQMNNISVSIPYFNKSGQSHALTIILSLQYTVTNSTSAESNENIKLKAPQAYYTQNRMVTAEDYNIAPITIDADILKVKSINRLSSGISKYFELNDITGKYSNTNIFADDGILYKEDNEYNFDFSFDNRNEVFSILKTQVEPIVYSPAFKSFYLYHYPRITLSNTNSLYWSQTNKTTNQSRGYFYTDSGPQSIGSFSSGNFTFLSPGALVKIEPPPGKYFNAEGKVTDIRVNSILDYKWTQVVGVTGDGANNGKGNLDDGTGPVILTGNIENSCVITNIIPKFKNIWSSALELEIVNLILAKRNFGISFDELTRDWYIIDDVNLDLINPFSLSLQKDVTNGNKDSSWMVSFEWLGKKFKVRYRTTNYIFESEQKTAFYVDKSKNNYDFTNDTVIKDCINVLSINDNINPPTTVIGTSTIYTTAEVQTGNSIIIKTISGTVASGNNTVILADNLAPSVTKDYIAIHPSIDNGLSTIQSVNDTNVVLTNLTIDSIDDGNFITFVPTSITSSIALTTTTSFTFSSNEVEKEFSLIKDYKWQIDSAVIEQDGYVEPKKVLISFFDFNDDGQIDDPDSFTNIIQSDVLTSEGYKNKFVYFQRSTDGLRYNLYNDNILAVPYESLVDTPIENQLYYFYKDDVIKLYKAPNFVYQSDLFAREGRANLKFHYIHNSSTERRIDPSKTNIIDVYLLTRNYDNDYRNWLAFGTGNEPLSPTTQSLEENYSYLLEPIKSISDEIIFHPAKYKVLFGEKASPPLQAIFKAVRNPTRTISISDVQTRILTAIEDFFKVDNWTFGQTFNFGELATYVMNIMSPDINNFVIVPKMDNGFGNLFQITCLSDEIFVNGATINDIQVIDNLTATELKTTYIATSS